MIRSVLRFQFQLKVVAFQEPDLLHDGKVQFVIVVAAHTRQQRRQSHQAARQLVTGYRVDHTCVEPAIERALAFGQRYVFQRITRLEQCVPETQWRAARESPDGADRPPPDKAVNKGVRCVE